MRNVAADDDDLPCILACTDRASQLNGALLEYVWKTLFVRWESSCKRENDSFPMALQPLCWAEFIQLRWLAWELDLPARCCLTFTLSPIRQL